MSNSKQNEITVIFDNRLLGKGIFWKGDPESIESIPNVPARSLAKRVAQDGMTRSDGMWTVYKNGKGDKNQENSGQ